MGARFLAQIVLKKKGHHTIRENKSFDTRDDALNWISEREASLKDGFESQHGIVPAHIAALPKIDANTTLSGVYFLFHGGACTYVGQSENVPLRIAKHKRSRAFDSYRVLPMPKEELKAAESYFIALMKPQENIAGMAPLKAIRGGVRQLEKLGLKRREIDWHLKAIMNIQHHVQHGGAA